jgi:hypothetical protein
MGCYGLTLPAWPHQPRRTNSNSKPVYLDRMHEALGEDEMNYNKNSNTGSINCMFMVRFWSILQRLLMAESWHCDDDSLSCEECLEKTERWSKW